MVPVFRAKIITTKYFVMRMCTGSKMGNGALSLLLAKGPNGRNDSTPFSAVFVLRLLFSLPP